MDALSKLKVLGEASRFDVCAACSSGKAAQAKADVAAARGIYMAKAANGRPVPIFKTLLSNYCKNDCRYCVNRAGRRGMRVSYEPEEYANTFMKLYRSGLAEGLFISSGIRDDPENTTDAMLETVEILRNRYNYHGYLHFKVMPGASYDQLKRAAELADRMSANLEAPNKLRFHELSSQKDFKIDLLRRMRWVVGLEKKGLLSAGQTTQLITGASGESDFETLRMTDWLYDKFNLRRTYFSAFSPIKDTPLEDVPKVSLSRAHRLYQADWLLRVYNMKFKELPFNDSDMLPRYIDPKLAMALSDPDSYPTDVNEANEEELLRVPGIGPKSAARIIAVRKKNPIGKFSVLKELGVVLKRARPFIDVGGKKQATLKSFA